MKKKTFWLTLSLRFDDIIFGMKFVTKSTKVFTSLDSIEIQKLETRIIDFHTKPITKTLFGQNNQNKENWKLFECLKVFITILIYLLLFIKFSRYSIYLENILNHFKEFLGSAFLWIEKSSLSFVSYDRMNLQNVILTGIWLVLQDELFWIQKWPT